VMRARQVTLAAVTLRRLRRQPKESTVSLVERKPGEVWVGSTDPPQRAAHRTHES
jgi:hypothetical protein